MQEAKRTLQWLVYDYGYGIQDLVGRGSSPPRKKPCFTYIKHVFTYNIKLLNVWNNFVPVLRRIQWAHSESACLDSI